MSILSDHFKVSIAAVDVQTLNSYIYGDSSCVERIYLLYDGIHYDAIVKSNAVDYVNAPNEIKLFSSTDNESLEQVRRLAAEFKSQRQFVDLSSFTLRCLVCNAGLRGQAEAKTHAKTTGHTNLAQI